MGKHIVSVGNNDNVDTESEQVSVEEEASEEEPFEEDEGEEEPFEEDEGEEEPFEENAAEEEPQKAESCKEPNEDSCGPDGKRLYGQEVDEVASCEVDPNEEEPDEDVSCGKGTIEACENSMKEACNEEHEASYEEPCEGEPYKEEAMEEESEEVLEIEESCEEESGEEEYYEEVLEVDESGEDEYYEEILEVEESSEEEPVEVLVEEEPNEELNEDPEKVYYEMSSQSNTGQMNMPSNMVSGPVRISKVSGIDSSSNDIMVPEKLATTGSTGKRRRSRWDVKDETSEVAEDGSVATEKGKTPLENPGVEIDLQIPKLFAQLFEITKLLQSAVLVDGRPKKERSPSPPPIYNILGMKINTREARVRSELMKMKQIIISELIRKNPKFKPPADYDSSMKPDPCNVGDEANERGDSVTKKKGKSRWSRWSSDDSQLRIESLLKTLLTQPSEEMRKETRKTRNRKKKLGKKLKKVKENGWSKYYSQLYDTESPPESPSAEIDPEIPKLNAQLLEITKKLQSEVIDHRSESERSPSPPPIFNSLGIKINTREARLRSQLTNQRQTIISELILKNPNFNPPPDYKNVSKLRKKLYIPSKEYPEYNFVGLILGPGGRTQKRMEEETGARIKLRGKDSVLRKKTLSLDEEDLHVLIEADNSYSLDLAVSMVEKLLIPIDDHQNAHKLSQLRELADLKGTLRGPRNNGSCHICGDASHFASACPLTAPSSGANSSGQQVSFFTETGINKKKIEGANLYVGQLPQSVDDNKLIELFRPFGPIYRGKVIMDKGKGLSRGYGFVAYTDNKNAAKAMAQMNGYKIEGKTLVVSIAGTNSGLEGLSGLKNLPTYPGPAAIALAQSNPDPMHWPGPPESKLPEAVASFSNRTICSFPTHSYFGQYPGPVGSSGQIPARLPEPIASFPSHSDRSFPTHNSHIRRQYPASDSSSSQMSASTSSYFPGNLSASSDLSDFPGYLKSLDPPPSQPYHQATVPSNSLSSASQAHFAQNYDSFYQMPRR